MITKRRWLSIFLFPLVLFHAIYIPVIHPDIIIVMIPDYIELTISIYGLIKLGKWA